MLGHWVCEQGGHGGRNGSYSGVQQYGLLLLSRGERREQNETGCEIVWKGSRDQIMAVFEAHIKDNGLYLKEVEGQDTILSDGKERNR